MKLFQYHRPTDTQSALDLFQKNEGAQYIAGATNLLDLMKKDIVAPDHLIDISRLPLNSIQNGPLGVTIGALALNSDVAMHQIITKQYPLVAQALLAGASPQLRNMATVGGNILQRTRCPYFYDIAMPCNKRQPGSGCGAKEGFNRMSAIFGASDSCVAVHPSDLCVALAALDATITVKSAKQERIIDFKDFHRLPGNTPEKDNILEKGELITSITIPKNNFAKYHNYMKVRDRASYAFALVSVAVAFEIKDSVILDARIVLGGVAHKPWRAYEAEAYLKGKSDSENSFKTAAALVVKEAKPLTHNAFKVKMAEQTVLAAMLAIFN
jgi:xanthine dehydrogenase YagS FAD-binding subunit